MNGRFEAAPAEEQAENEYLAALRAADRNDRQPLMEILERQFEDV